MEITWDSRKNIITVAKREIIAWSKVRNEINGFRPSVEKVAKNDPDIFFNFDKDGKSEKPSMPRRFPIGNWEITGIVRHPDPVKEKYYFPYYIATNAHQRLAVWERDGQGFYASPTQEEVEDYFYGLHFSSSDWTQGCIRISEKQDLLYLVSIILPELKSGNKVRFIAM